MKLKHLSDTLTGNYAALYTKMRRAPEFSESRPASQRIVKYNHALAGALLGWQDTKSLPSTESLLEAQMHIWQSVDREHHLSVSTLSKVDVIEQAICDAFFVWTAGERSGQQRISIIAIFNTEMLSDESVADICMTFSGKASVQEKVVTTTVFDGVAGLHYSKLHQHLKSRVEHSLRDFLLELLGKKCRALCLPPPLIKPRFLHRLRLKYALSLI